MSADVIGVAAAAQAADSTSHPFSSHPLISLVSACFWVILWALSWVKWIVAFTTLTIPSIIYSVLSYSMTLTLNFWSFAIIFVCSMVVLSYFIRFRYLNDYTQLKEPPLVKPDGNELHPDVNTDPPPTFHNYLDDFLQAVRVFGFLEKPVFHELARHLQTRRLIAGDSISLDQDKSFYCVVDGMVQVFAQTEKETDEEIGWEDEEMNGYQLLNEVGSGGTLSSLFTILSLFTEDVKMSWQDDELDEGISMSNRKRPANSDVPHLELITRPRRSSTNSNASTVHPELLRGDSMSPVFVEEPESMPSTPPTTRPPLLRRPGSIYRGVVARATEDTTLAVIPAEAFRRLTKKFPKATGHIVQVIVTRFARVTFNAAHKYLGLTSEILRTERAMNDIACHPLPDSFYQGGGLEHLRQRFDTGGRSETSHDYFGLGDPASVMTPLASRISLSGSSGDSTSTTKVKLEEPPVPNRRRPSSSHSGPFRNQARSAVQAGDLMTSANQMNDNYPAFRRTFSILNTPKVSSSRQTFFPDAIHSRQSSGASTEDFDLRDEVMSCIAKSIGLLQPPMSGTDSLEASPALAAFDPVGRSPSGSSEMFKSSFGSLSLLDLGDDTSSLTGGSSTIASGDGYMSGLDNEVEILFFPAGSTLAKAGDLNTGLFYCIQGFLDILLPGDEAHVRKSFEDSTPSVADSEPWRTPGVKSDKDKQRLLFTVKPGGIAGYLAALCNSASYVDIKAKTDVYVGFLPSDALERLLEKRPIVLLTLAKRLISLLSPLLLHIDASLDWMQVNAGQVLWRPGDVSDSFYIVINGRLRALTETEAGAVTMTGEYGQGDTVGELDVITSSPRRTTVHAIRDTELIRMPQTLFNAISARNPKTTAKLLRTIASRVRDEVDSSSSSQPRVTSDNNNLKTVVVLPVSRLVPIDAFARKLQAALEGIGATTSYLNQASISNHLGRHAFTRMGKLKAAGWLADQEQKYRTVLYVADSPVNSAWTQTCIRQADCVMVVGMGDDPSIGEYERLLLSMKTTARKELVLLHPDRAVVPGSTREWLKNRPWVHQHIHVELPGLVVPITKPPPPKDPDAVTTLKNLREKVQSEIQKYRKSGTDPRPQRLPHMNDFSRLARRICGKSIGLVLGGGGARGVSHLGLIRAFEEAGIPIDHIGGTSIGAFIGGLYAREGDILSSAGRAKQFSSRMGNIWRILSDVTYPLVAYTTGHEFNRAIYKAFYDLHIEDMWLPFFCNSTNIMTSRMEIHEDGYAWRFIRASMTLVGLLPPLCNNGGMLVDGGYVDNLPVSTMFTVGASCVFASDVGSLEDNTPRNFSDSISGWWLLVNRWNPFSDARLVPPITEIQSRLAYVSSVKTLEDAKVARDCLYIRMPVQEYGTLQFSKFEEIEKVGYEAGLAILEKMDEEGRLPSAFIDGSEGVQGGKKKNKRGRGVRRNSI